VQVALESPLYNDETGSRPGSSTRQVAAQGLTSQPEKRKGARLIDRKVIVAKVTLSTGEV
jgi:hypothetical protein